MGQYHYVMNLDKYEFLNPHKLGLGLKAREQAHSAGSTPHLLFALTMCCNGRGGGDFRDCAEIVGRWAGDRIAIVGDYAEDADLPEQFRAGSMGERRSDEKSALVKLARCAEGVEEAHLAQDPETAIYLDISDLCIPFIESEFGIKIDTESGGWRKRSRVGEDE